MGLSLYPMGPMLGLKESGTQSWLVIHGSQKRTIRSHEIRCFLMFLQSSHGIWRYLNYEFNHLIIILIIMIWEESGTLSMDNTYKYPWLNPYSTYNVPIHWEHDIGYGSIQKKIPADVHHEKPGFDPSPYRKPIGKSPWDPVLGILWAEALWGVLNLLFGRQDVSADFSQVSRFSTQSWKKDEKSSSKPTGLAGYPLII